jgi:glycosyltransferase involved in cell wall biosynthesis/predicted O-methyltransferase YrrM
MPTRDRRDFVPQAIRYFLAQDYAESELVILDDGEESVADLVPNDPRLRYHRLSGKRTLGAKRNECVEASRGDLILHWDDDDWMAPRRIRCQVEALLKSNAEICGLRQLLFYELATGATWLYEYPANQRAWLAGGSLLYTRDFWRRSPFPDIQVASDTRFIWSQRLESSVAVPDYKIYVATIHKGNTSPKNRRGAYWKRTKINLQEIVGPDWSFYNPRNRSDSPSRKTVTLQPLRSESIAPPPRTTSQRVTVSIPYFGCKQHIRRAVQSILDQTEADLRLVVVNDGDAEPPWPQLVDINDPRLVRFDLQSNQGRYFADQVVLAATSDPYFMVQDADDWSEPTRIAACLRQLREEHADCATTACLRHRPSGRSQVERLSARWTHVTGEFHHRVWHYALFKTDALRRIGGYSGAFRIGYDTLLMNFMLMTVRVAYLDKPLYNRLNRPDSLINSAATGLRSPARKEAVARLRALYSTAFAWREEYLAGIMDRDELAARLRKLACEQLSPQAQALLDQEARRLAALLETPPAVSEINRVGAATRQTISSLLHGPLLNWEGWSIGLGTAQELARRILELKPRRILELGAGNSTVVLAAAASEIGAEFVSLEHDPAYYEQTDRLLCHAGLRQAVNCQLAPLRKHELPTGGESAWYNANLSGHFDFIFADGPPEQFGRRSILFTLQSHLAPRWELWLHDGNRAHERACVELWKSHFDLNARLAAFEPKGVWILSNRSAPATRRLAITFLTGRRLALFRQTVESLRAALPIPLEQLFTIVMVNSNDPDTARYVEELGFVHERIDHHQNVERVGPATTRLILAAARRADVDYILHMEDDWRASTENPGWLARAFEILEQHPEIGQVRLRRSDETVLTRHMITAQPIAWENHADIRVARSAHYTFNPSVIRRTDALRIFPARDEREAQERFLRTGLATAQLIPGVFTHIGAGQSLRLSD